jgi:hypothetical protein
MIRSSVRLLLYIEGIIRTMMEMVRGRMTSMRVQRGKMRNLMCRGWGCIMAVAVAVAVGGVGEGEEDEYRDGHQEGEGEEEVLHWRRPLEMERKHLHLYRKE